MNAIPGVIGAQRSPLLSLSKRRAFLVHLLLSTLVVGTVCTIIFFVWYPGPYFDARGAWSILRVLVGVDLILGPTLTLILYKPGKPGLLFDLIVIAVIQLSALIYGTTVFYQERPYFTVFAVDRFQVLARGEVDETNVDLDELGDKPFVGPLLVAAVLPDDPAEFQRLLEEVLFEGKPDLERRPEYWRRYEERRSDVVARAMSLERLADARPGARRQIETLLRENPGLVYLPLVSGGRDLAFVIDPETAMPVEIVAVDPWLTGAPSSE